MSRAMAGTRAVLCLSILRAGIGDKRQLSVRFSVNLTLRNTRYYYFAFLTPETNCKLEDPLMQRKIIFSKDNGKQLSTLTPRIVSLPKGREA